jgi:membrane protease YdiL (CAAX protease family)
MITSPVNFLRQQWQAIDAEYRTESLPSGQAAAVLVTVALSLILGRFFGGQRFLAENPGVLEPFNTLPYPDIHPHLYWSAFKLVTYVGIPALCIKLVLRKSIRDYGFRFVRKPRVWLLYTAMFLAVLPLAYVASLTQDFANTYPKYRTAGESWTQLLVWSFAYGLQFLTLEFFFRGFLIFALARWIGSLAIFVMVVPYAMIHFGKPLAECLGSVLAGIALGTVALRTRSIYGGVAVHCGVAWAMDLFALSHTGALARLLGR